MACELPIAPQEAGGKFPGRNADLHRIDPLQRPALLDGAESSCTGRGGPPRPHPRPPGLETVPLPSCPDYHPLLHHTGLARLWLWSVWLATLSLGPTTTITPWPLGPHHQPTLARREREQHTGAASISPHLTSGGARLLPAGLVPHQQPATGAPRGPGPRLTWGRWAPAGDDGKRAAAVDGARCLKMGGAGSGAASALRPAGGAGGEVRCGPQWEGVVMGASVYALPPSRESCVLLPPSSGAAGWPSQSPLPSCCPACPSVPSPTHAGRWCFWRCCQGRRMSER